MAVLVVGGVVGIFAWKGRKPAAAKGHPQFDAAFAAIKKDFRPCQASLDAAVEALAKPENAEALRDAVKSERETNGLLMVVGAIRKLDDRGAAPALVTRLKEMKSNRDAYPAGVDIAELVAAWKVPEAVDPLVDLPEFYHPHGGRPPLAEMGAGATARLVEATAKADDPRRFSADRVLAATRDPGSKDVLVAAAKAGRLGAIQALGGYPSADVEIELAGIADGADMLLADAAVFSLLRIDPSRHRLRLLPILRAPDAARVIPACRIAALYGVAGAAPALRALLERKDQGVVFAAIEAMTALDGDEIAADANADGSWTVRGAGTTLQVTDPLVAAELKRRQEGGR